MFSFFDYFAGFFVSVFAIGWVFFIFTAIIVYIIWSLIEKKK
jgi:phage shock protein PspC (stress-responsive transcriptional regulator)